MTVAGAPTQDVDLAFTLEAQQDSTKYSLNCHQLGSIVSYDSSNQTCEIELGVLRLLPNGSEIKYPLLLDVPVIILSGGGASLTFPIEAGDKCLVLFNDRDIDIFLEEDRVALPNSPRAHDYSDGIALVGLRSVSEREATNEDAAQLHTKDKKVAILNNEQSLLTLIEGLIDLTKAITVGGGTPVDGTAQTNLELYKLEFQKLLDVGV